PGRLVNKWGSNRWIQGPPWLGLKPQVVVAGRRVGGHKPAMRVILDDSQLAFSQPLALIRAERPDEVPVALAALEAARAAGHWLAGWFGYELGYALEARLMPLAPAKAPLLSFGVFERPDRELPKARGRAYAGPLTLEW